MPTPKRAFSGVLFIASIASIACVALLACRAQTAGTSTTGDAGSDRDANMVRSGSLSASGQGASVNDAGPRAAEPDAGAATIAQHAAAAGNPGPAPSNRNQAGAGGVVGDAVSAGAAAAGATAECAVTPGSQVGVFTDPIQTQGISPPDPPGIAFKDTDGNPVNAHGGGVIKVCDTFYLHGEYFLSTSTDNNFNGFSMYSSKNLATWKNEGIILPQQASGQLGPNRKGERPHIIQCPSTGEFVLYAHAADSSYQSDKEVVFATSQKVNGPYAFKGPLTNAGAMLAAHSDMSALTDGNDAYVVTESGWVYTLSSDCHAWTLAKQYSAVNGMSGGVEAPTVFKAGDTYYWVGSDKTGWRANDDFYSTAPALKGPWTFRGNLAPAGKRTWMTQSTWVIQVAGSQGTTYVYWGDHWYGNQDTSAPGKHNNLATYVFQPLVFDGTAISLPTYQASWTLDVGAGTWSN